MAIRPLPTSLSLAHASLENATHTCFLIPATHHSQALEFCPCSGHCLKCLSWSLVPLFAQCQLKWCPLRRPAWCCFKCVHPSFFPRCPICFLHKTFLHWEWHLGLFTCLLLLCPPTCTFYKGRDYICFYLPLWTWYKEPIKYLVSKWMKCIWLVSGEIGFKPRSV